MNRFQKTGVWVLVVLLTTSLVYIIVLLSKKTPPGVYIELSEWEHIQRVMATPPDTVVKDSIIYLEKTVYRTIPAVVDSSKIMDIAQSIADNMMYLRFYADSIINDTVNIVIHDSIAGELRDRRVEVTPVVHTNIKEVVRYVPLIVKEPAEGRKTMFYGKLQTGGNKKRYLFGGEIGIISKKDVILSVGARYDFNSPTAEIGLGIVF